MNHECAALEEFSTGGSSWPATTRVAACPASCADRSSGERPAGGASEAGVSLGWEVCRRRIASSWRRMRISSSFERRGRASSQTSASRFRATRYANDQSKKPSLDHQQEHPNLASQNSRGRVCEPYGLLSPTPRDRRNQLLPYVDAVVDPHFQPDTRPACSIHLCI